MRIQNACAPPPRTAPIEEPLRSVRRTGVMEAHEGGAPTSPALMDPLSPSGPLAAAVSSSARLRGAASFVLSQVSGVESLARTDRPGSRAAARVMEEGTMKVFVFDPLNVDALAELLGRRDGGQVLSEGRAAIANGWRLVFGGQSKKWGCSVASLIQAPGERVQAARPRTAIMTRHQLPVVLGEDEAAYGFVLRLELRELAEYERTRHSRRHYDRISLRVLARQRDGRSFAEETCVAYVLRPEAMKLFTAPSSAYLDALRATLRAYWQLHGLVVRDGTGRQILDWEEPHGTIQYEDNEPLKPLLASIGEQRGWKPSDANRAVQKLHAIGIYDLQGLLEALGGRTQRQQTLNRRLRQAGFKVFGKEAMTLLSLAVRQAIDAEDAQKVAQPQLGQRTVEQPKGGAERVARAIKEGIDTDTGVEVVANASASRK